MQEDFKIIGLMLVKNDDYYVKYALSNALGFCDKMIVLDNESTDGTSAIIDRIVKTTESQIDVHRIGDVGDSHDYVLPYLGKRVWLFAVDGDEIYDPRGLQRFRPDLLAGVYEDYWQIYGSALNVKRLHKKSGRVTGYSSPPGRSMTKLYNLSAVESWEGCTERLHGGTLKFKSEWPHGQKAYAFHKHMSWEQTPFRCLHMAFVRRSSQRSWATPRLCPADVISKRIWSYNLARRVKTCMYYHWVNLLRKSGKDAAYRQGRPVTLDASAFGVFDDLTRIN